MKKIIGLSLFAVLAMVSCKKNESAEQLKIDSTQVAAQQAPVVSETSIIEETKKQPETSLALSEPSFDFGKIKKGDVVEHIYEVTNTGKNPLIISSVQPTCGCTVPDYTKDPILPGQKGKITLKFDSASFDGLVSKQAEVYANVEKSPIVISFSADIQP